MSWMNEHEWGLRTAVLGLLLLGFLGPWRHPEDKVSVMP